jgi:hypothetical protein
MIQAMMASENDRKRVVIACLKLLYHVVSSTQPSRRECGPKLPWIP